MIADSIEIVMVKNAFVPQIDKLPFKNDSGNLLQLYKFDLHITCHLICIKILRNATVTYCLANFPKFNATDQFTEIAAAVETT